MTIKLIVITKDKTGKIVSRQVITNRTAMNNIIKHRTAVDRYNRFAENKIIY